jgi:hypothetical protein
MSNIGLFAIGTFVTMLVVASVSLLVWAAILDGRDQQSRYAAERDASERRTREHGPQLVDAA